ncbi:hypothetical protein EUX98_g4514 [Antrodiella citrinella]|uniref:RNA polymerase I-specific transcription initiation factor RRN3 n=1 Tax=Antrodiella citrinella TaxID=2447956 RepID=A0A4S4MWI6_9APHY|nr:hypothetical protein EUX98_g4514 [Antrodiella citrinella]
MLTSNPHRQVEIQVEIEEIEEQLAGRDETELFELDPFDTVVGQEGEDSDSDDDSDDGDDDLSDLSSDGDSEDEENAAEVTSDFKHINDMVQKLDAILKNVFDYFNKSHGRFSPTHTPSRSLASLNSRSDSPLLTPLEAPALRPPSPTLIEEGRAFRRRQFYTLLSIFDRVILRTFKSRYTQFLVFWYSSLDPEFSDVFQGMLVSKALLEEDQPSVTRAAAASYIASFVSRAQFVDQENTRRVMACLCDFLRSKLDTFDMEAQNGLQSSGMAQYSVFYAVAQAVFLIFCFRWRDLAHDEEELEDMDGIGAKSKWMKELDVMKRVVTSELNPLKMCSVNVVMQFAKVSHSVDFLYCYPIIEANRRSDYAPSSGQARSRAPLFTIAMMGNSMQMELNTFFPFDPYKLPRSGPYIDGVYREWSSVAIGDDEESEDEEEAAEEQDEEHSYSGAIGIAINGAREKVLDETEDVLGQSFGGMSISPIPARMSGVPMSVS